MVLTFSQSLYSQFALSSNFLLAQEFSKEVTLYKAKAYVINEILGGSEDVIQFEIDPLAATTSGELTSLVYKCAIQSKEGLILGFYGNYWNDEGIVFKGYAFKNFPKEKALQLLLKISETIDKQLPFLNEDSNNNNVYFQYDDVTFLIYKDMTTI